jgi:hypothetical protein
MKQLTLVWAYAETASLPAMKPDQVFNHGQAQPEASLWQHESGIISLNLDR